MHLFATLMPTGDVMTLLEQICPPLPPRRYATDPGIRSLQEMPIEHEFWRFYHRTIVA